MSLSHDQVRHIATLARLTFNDDEIAKLATQMTSILTYVDQLQKVDTEGVEPASQAIELSNVLRDDEIRPKTATREELLATSPLPIVDHHIETPHAHG